MALTVFESAAVFDLLHWLGCPVRPSEQLVDDERAAAALALLADHAGRTLHIPVQPGEARQAIERVAAARAADDVYSARELEGQLTLGDVTP